jgi:parallel beta-helix repeat protein
MRTGYLQGGGNSQRARIVRVSAVSIALLTLAAFAALAPAAGASAVLSGGSSGCHRAGSTGLTAKMIVHNSETIEGQVINAAGCDVGIFAGPGIKNVTIRDDVVTGANDHGIFVQDSSHDVISNNTVVGNGVLPFTHSCNAIPAPCIAEDKAIQLSGTSYSWVSGNYVEGNTADGGIGISDDGVEVDPGALLPAGTNHHAIYNEVRNNDVVNNNLGGGIVVAGYNSNVWVANTFVEGNTIIGLSVDQTGGYTGIDVGGIVVVDNKLGGTVHGTFVIDNTIYGSQLPGIVVHANANGAVLEITHIYGNRISDNSGYPPPFATPNTPLNSTGIAIVAEVYGQPAPPYIGYTDVVHNRVGNDMVGLWLCQTHFTVVHALHTSNVTTAETTCASGGS